MPQINKQFIDNPQESKESKPDHTSEIYKVLEKVFREQLGIPRESSLKGSERLFTSTLALLCLYSIKWRLGKEKFGKVLNKFRQLHSGRNFQNPTVKERQKSKENSSSKVAEQKEDQKPIRRSGKKVR